MKPFDFFSCTVMIDMVYKLLPAEEKICDVFIDIPEEVAKKAVFGM